jgi:rRNA-processing protein FCF1
LPVRVLVVDASALFLPFEHGIDLQKEAQRLLPGARLIVPTPIIEELAHLAAQGKGAQKRNARTALTYAARFEEHKIGGKGDDSVVQTARQIEKGDEGVAVATLDRGLRHRCRAKKWPVLTLRGHTLFVDGYAP